MFEVRLTQYAMACSITEIHLKRGKEEGWDGGREGGREVWFESIETHFKLLVKLGEQVECSLHVSPWQPEQEQRKP